MAYLRICRDLGQGAAEIQARLLALLDARSGAVSRPGGYWLSNLKSPFGRPGYATLFQPCHSVAARFGVLFAALILAVSGAVQAKTVTALTPSLFDVNKAIGSAVDGDTVIIPAGKATWTSQLAITKAITLMGKTTTDSLAGTANDQTIIQYNITAPKPLITVNSVAGKSYRISGFTFQDIRTTGQKPTAFMVLNGQSQSVRLDNCHFQVMPLMQQYVRVAGGVYGVADHNFIEDKNSQVFGFYNGCAGGSLGTFGHVAWSRPTAWGSSQFFFVEDNYVTHSTATVQGALTDGGAGAKFVVRHNHLYNLHLTVHGTEGNPRGGRAMEICNNDFHNAINGAEDRPGGMRSGGLLFHDNTWDGRSPIGSWALSVFRIANTWGGGNRGSQAFTGWEGANGSSPWDVNDTEGNGTYVKGHAPFQYWPTTPGTWATAGAGTTPLKIVDNGNPGWTTDKWKHFGILKKDDGRHNRIDDTTNGNTNLVASTVTYTGKEMTWAPGSQYQIHKCLVALDQESRGQGDLVTGTPGHFINSKTGTRAWPNQMLEPVYAWNNRHLANGAYIGVHSEVSTMHENTDFYNQAAAVDGVQATGVGVGTLAQRPASGKNGFDIAHVTPNPPGTAYWATDVPSKNGSKDKGALYVWMGGGWVLYYQPYTYPHPLVTGLASAHRPSD
jgi:hypothetical protein